MMLDEGPTSANGIKALCKKVDLPSFTVWVLTKGGGGISSLVTTQLTVSPAVILPEQPEE